MQKVGPNMVLLPIQKREIKKPLPLTAFEFATVPVTNAWNLLDKKKINEVM